MKILTFDDGKLVVKEHGTVVARITSIEEFNAACAANDGRMMCSSSVDFPHEYTTDPALIALCAEIRS
jgi:hypothetical protein